MCRSFRARARAATERHAGPLCAEVERSADAMLIDRESGTAGTDFKATAESGLTADPNSARSDLESSAGTDSDNGGNDRQTARVAARLVAAILVLADAKSAESAQSGIG